MATVVEGVFGAAAFRRAAALVPLVEQWRPDLVVHPITELAAAVAAERCGARHAVHGLGPLPREAWDWFGARFRDLCTTWDVPIWGPPSWNVRTSTTARPPSSPMRWRPREPAAGARHARRGRARRAPPVVGRRPCRTALRPDGAPHARHAVPRRHRGVPDGARGSHTARGQRPRHRGARHRSARLGPQPPQVLVADFVAHELLLPHWMRSSPRAAPARSSPRSVSACPTSSCPRAPTSSSTAPPPRRRGSPSPSPRPS